MRVSRPAFCIPRRPGRSHFLLLSSFRRREQKAVRPKGLRRRARNAAHTLFPRAARDLSRSREFLQAGDSFLQFPLRLTVDGAPAEDAGAVDRNDAPGVAAGLRDGLPEEAGDFEGRSGGRKLAEPRRQKPPQREIGPGRRGGGGAARQADSEREGGHRQEKDASGKSDAAKLGAADEILPRPETLARRGRDLADRLDDPYLIKRIEPQDPAVVEKLDLAAEVGEEPAPGKPALRRRDSRVGCGI